MNWSFQLYSARNTALPEALRIVSEAGYSSVETYRDNYTDVSAFSKALDANGLRVSSMHVNIGALREQAKAHQDIAAEFGCSHIVCPYLDEHERPADAAGWSTLVAELEEQAKRWRDAGYTFAWHNHDFEFRALADGAIPMQLILEKAPSLQWEIDVAWVARAGVDPAPWIEEHAGRISAVHLKDIAPDGECVDEDGWADLGYGVVPWKALMPKLQATPATVYAMEHDNPSDLERFATRSIATASALIG